MTKKYYLVEEKDLETLLYQSLKYIALENGGVSSWEWYSESIGDFIEEYIRENNITFEDPDEYWDYSLKNIAEEDFKNYTPIELDLDALLQDNFSSMSFELNN